MKPTHGHPSQPQSHGHPTHTTVVVSSNPAQPHHHHVPGTMPQFHPNSMFHHPHPHGHGQPHPTHGHPSTHQPQGPSW